MNDNLELTFRVALVASLAAAGAAGQTAPAGQPAGSSAVNDSIGAANDPVTKELFAFGSQSTVVNRPSVNLQSALTNRH